MRFTVITTCKGRLHHLQHTLPLFLQGADRVVVVDYSCPQGAGDWAEQMYGNTGKLLVKRVSGQRGFNKSRANNAGASHAWSLGMRGFYCFLDADNITPPLFWMWLRTCVRPGVFYIAATTPPIEQVTLRIAKQAERANQLTGALVVEAPVFIASGGYDTGFTGRGFQDLDMRYRLFLKMGVPFAEIPKGLLGVIEHSPELRVAYYGETQQQSHERNRPRMQENINRWTESWRVRVSNKGIRILRRTSGPG